MLKYGCITSSFVFLAFKVHGPVNCAGDLDGGAKLHT